MPKKRKDPLAWRLALFRPVVPLAMYLPGVLMSLDWCATGHELYQESPGTIIAVLIKAMLFQQAEVTAQQ
jgi:hypothetical protein